MPRDSLLSSQNLSSTLIVSAIRSADFLKTTTKRQPEDGRIVVVALVVVNRHPVARLAVKHSSSEAVTNTYAGDRPFSENVCSGGQRVQGNTHRNDAALTVAVIRRFH